MMLLLLTARTATTTSIPPRRRRRHRWDRIEEEVVDVDAAGDWDVGLDVELGPEEGELPQVCCWGVLWERDEGAGRGVPDKRGARVLPDHTLFHNLESEKQQQMKNEQVLMMNGNS